MKKIILISSVGLLSPAMVVACTSLDQSNINIELEEINLKNHIKKLN